MRIKRLYDHDAPKKDWVQRTERCGTCGGRGVVLDNEEPKAIECPEGCDDGVLVRKVPPVSSVIIQHAGPRQKFTPRIVGMGQRDGWLERDGDLIKITGENGSAVYEIQREPGFYCCHCGEDLFTAPDAREHVELVHQGEESPDPQNPAGYERANYFETVRVGEDIDNG